jgi:dTDP-4-dehydrorhamnose reductase
VYGTRGKNFFRKILRLAREQKELKVVNDQIGSPTWSAAIATVIGQWLTSLKDLGKGKIIDKMVDHAGVYHWAASGECSWHEFAVEILATDPSPDEHLVQRVIPIASSQFPSQARRPEYSVLATDKISSTYGIKSKPWQVHLSDCWKVMRGIL